MRNDSRWRLVLAATATAATVAMAMAGVPAALALQSGQLLTTASAVRLRAQPSGDAVVVAELPLGTELTPTSAGSPPDATGNAHGPGRAWIGVTSSAGQSGFVAAGFVRAFDPARRFDLVTAIARERLARTGDGVRARAELVQFLEREIAGRHGEEAATLDLLRLRALDQLVTNRLIFGPAWPAPWDRWLNARRGELWYNEVGGSFIIRREAILAAHLRHRGTAAADDILWFAHDIGVGGECEGSISCYAERLNLLAGDYLRAYPAGRHVQQALSAIDRSTTFWLSDIVPTRIFERGYECVRLPEPLTTLRAAVAAVAHRDRDGALARLDQVAAACR